MSRMTITKRDTYKFSVTVKDSDGVVFDLTGYTMEFTAKVDPTQDDTEAVISSVAVISDPTTGVGTFTLLPTQTDVVVRVYEYDVQISDGANNVYTIVKGKLEILQDVKHEK